jgi:glycosyltransferase involved in cell wall biosynthesis
MAARGMVLLDARLWSGSGLSRVTREMVPRVAAELGRRGVDYRLLAGANHADDVAQYGVVEVVRAGMHDIRLGLDMRRLGRKYPAAVFYSPHYRAFPSFPGKQLVTVCDLIYLRCGYPIQFRLYVRVYLRRLRLTRVTALCISESTLAEMRADYPHARAEIVYCGVRSPSSREPSPRAARRGVLYVGDASRHKNLSTLVDAVRLARERGSAMKLTIAGSLESCRSLPDFVELRHRPSDDDLAGLYSDAVAVVQPSLMEGFSLVPFEAASHGTPAVVSRIPAHVEMLGSAAEMFAPKDSAALADALLRLENDEEWWNECQRRLRELSIDNRFSWDQAASRVTDLLTAS